MTRRRPVSSAWRERHHRLTAHSRVAGRAPVHGNVYRCRGRGSCGVEFNSERNPDGTRRNSNTMDRAAVIEAWKDHVEERYYELREQGRFEFPPLGPTGEGDPVYPPGTRRGDFVPGARPVYWKGDPESGAWPYSVTYQLDRPAVAFRCHNAGGSSPCDEATAKRFIEWAEARA